MAQGTDDVVFRSPRVVVKSAVRVVESCCDCCWCRRAQGDFHVAGGGWRWFAVASGVAASYGCLARLGLGCKYNDRCQLGGRRNEGAGAKVR